ncbi:TetR/AcrR family transcriptional regulator [Streptomyces sp. SID4956]|uniref:TetR family transcriptional regulator n=1 Tax=Streptomyces sp. SID4956 TaxID=2690290 RepID=UPI00136D75B8|nr:TetR family transcriptional regulator [Streptomyces sp. SID4956]
MAGQGRRGRPAGVDGEQTRRRIMAVAAEHVSVTGYGNATMKSIAERAGLTGAAIYRYFPSKQALVCAILGEVVDDIMDRLDRATRVEGSLRVRFVSFLEEAIASTRDYPSAMRLHEVVQLEVGRHPEFVEVLRARQVAEEKLYDRLIEDAVITGELPPDVDRRAICDMLLSIVWGLTHLAAVAPPDRHAAAVRQVEELLATGSLLPRRA